MYEVVIIGSGFSGICAAITLQRMGIDNYLILERDEELGGTWWRNSYPGAAVDVPSILYSFSFEPYDWSRKFAKQSELLEYTHFVIDKYGLRAKSRVNSEVVKMHYDEQSGHWHLQTKDGVEHECESVINGAGGLSQPKFPDFPGVDRFQGKTMHTGLWDHDYDYRGKRIAVIGTGASAVQVIPELAKEAGHLTIFQRTPHWMMPRPDRELFGFERKIRKNKWINRLLRKALYWQFEGRVIPLIYLTFLLRTLPQHQARWHINKHIKDKKLRELLTPDFTIGCKRILLCSRYYPSLNRDNVELLGKDSGLKKFYEKGIETIKGEKIEFDLVVFATGFHAAENSIPFPVIGRNGLTIQEAWKAGSHAYLGVTVPDFPNFYIIPGPGTAIGHTSQIFMIECHTDYIRKLIEAKREKRLKSIEVKKEVSQVYNEKIQQELKKTVWQTGGCKSWYQQADGKITTLYPRFTWQYQRDCRNAKLEDHLLEPTIQGDHTH